MAGQSDKVTVFTAWLLTSADLAGWRSARFDATWNSSCPTVLLVRGHEVVTAKTRTADAARKPLSPQQQEWLDNIRSSGIEAYDWTPADHAEILERLNRPEAAK